MSSNPVRVVFHLDHDSALVGVVRSAVQFQAAQAGFETQTCAEMGAASEGVCHETLSQVSEAESGLEIALETFPDRMEISFVHSGQMAPSVGLEKFALPDASAAGGINGLELLSRVDRVLYTTQEGKVRTTLVKFLKPQG
jgi:hypothetical protein